MLRRLRRYCAGCHLQVSTSPSTHSEIVVSGSQSPRARARTAAGLALVLALAVLAGLLAAAPAMASPNGIVISEFRFRGPAGGNDEFVELRNTSGAPVDISGYKLQGCASGSGAPSDRATVPAGTSLAAGQAYLFTNNAAAGYSGSVPGDQTYGSGITDLQPTNASGARIVDASGNAIDGVGSTKTEAPTSQCKEGSGLTTPATPATGSDPSFERKSGGTQDTDDNGADFDGPKAGNPQNRAGSGPPPPPPSGGSIVVSEFRFRGPDPDGAGPRTGALDEFVELRNTSTAPVDISGYKLEGCGSNGPTGIRATVAPGEPPLAPGESYLLVNSSGFSGSQRPDGIFFTGISDNGGVRLLNSTGAVVDAVGSSSTVAACHEGTGLTIPTSDGDNSFERKAGGTQDTGDNAADFDGPKAAGPQARNSAVDASRTPTKISAIQGSGASSPFTGSAFGGVTFTIQGTVTGIDDEVGQSNDGTIFPNERGIFVQEETADQDTNPSSSEAIFVGRVGEGGPLPPLGSTVRVTGQVRELFGFTILEETPNREPQVVGTGPLPAPVEIDDAAAASQSPDTRPYYESLESMRVSESLATANSGGTNKFDELFLTPGSTKNRVFRTEPTPALFATDEDAGSGNPPDPDNPNNKKSTTVVNADLFDTVRAIQGPFAFNFGNFKVMVQEGVEPTVEDTGVTYPYTARIPDGLRPFDPGQIRVLSYNLNNYFDNVDDPAKDDEFDETTDFEPEKRQRATDAINNIMKRPDVLSVQEAENKAVLDRLAASLGGYTAFLEEGNDSRGIDVGFLVKTDPSGVQASNPRQLGKNEPQPASIPSGVRCSDVEGPGGQVLLFDRPPLAIDITTRNGQTFTVFGSHFAAKGGSGPEDGRGECRAAQAQFLRDRVQEVKASGKEAIVAADLNAFENEMPLQILEGGGLLDNQWDREPDPEQRYSFQFDGRLQTLDHVLLTQGLNSQYDDFQYAHFNVDYFERERPQDQFSTDGHKLSVHDPPIVTLNDQGAPPPPPPPAGVSCRTGDGGSNRGAATIVVATPGTTTNGTEGDDVIVGTPGDDTINGRGGNDKICGAGGNDRISGNQGDDELSGNQGHDVLSGNQGNDTLYGDAGNDTLNGDAGNDRLLGGSANDDLIGGSANDDLFGEDGQDRLVGQDGQDSLYGGAGDDKQFGDAGDDKLYGGAGNDRLEGGDGNDRLFGEDGNDRLRGNGGDDRLRGDQGNDELDGGADTDDCSDGAGSNTEADCEV